MATERIVLEISEKGGRRVVKVIDDIGDQSEKSSKQVDFLKSALGAIGGVLAIRELIQYADTWTLIGNRLRIVTDGQANLTRVTDELFQVSQRSRTSFESTADLYARVARSSKELNLSQRELLDITETINQAVSVSGATSQEASAGLIQFAQGLASGALRGDELRSVLEQMPRLAQAIAEGMGITVGQLRELGAQGQLSAKAVLTAIQDQAPQIAAEFESTIPTVEQALINVDNAFLKFVGDMNSSLGITEALASGLQYLAENFEIVEAAAFALGAALVIAYGPNIVSALKKATLAVRAFSLALVANPIGLIATAIAAGVAALIAFQDATFQLNGETVTLGETVGAVWDLMKDGIVIVYNVWKGAWGGIFDLVDDFFGLFGTGLDGALSWLKDFVNTGIGLFRGFFRSVVTLWENLPEIVGDIFYQAVNGMIAAFEAGLNALIAAANSASEFLGLDFRFDQVDFEEVFNPFKNAAASTASEIAQIFRDELSTDFLGELADGLGTTVDNLLAVIQQKIEENRAAAATQGDLTGAEGGDVFKLTTQQLSDFGNLKDKLDPTTKALRDFADAEFLLGDALKAGELDLEQYNFLMEQLRFLTEDARDPLAAIHRELTLEKEALSLTAEEREVHNQLLSLERELRAAGIVLSDDQRQSLEQELTALQALNDEMKRQDQLFRSIRGPMDDYAKNLQALVGLLNQGKISSEEFNDALIQQRIQFLNSQKSVEAGLERGLLEMQQEMTDFASQGAQIVGDMFQGFEDAIVRFVQTGKLSFSDLVDSLIADLARLALRMFILGPILNAVTSLLPGTLGGTDGLSLPGGGIDTSNVTILPGTIVPGLAEGGIVTSPTIAALAEYGHAEAVIPLSNGAVPVTFTSPLSFGGDQAAPTVEINITNKAPDTEVKASEGRTAGGGRRIDVEIVRVVRNGIVSGEFDGALGQSFGLGRAPGRRN